MADKHQSIWTLNEVYDLKVNNNWPQYVPPPVTNGFGWFMCGDSSGNSNVIQRLDFGNDTSDAVDRSDNTFAGVETSANSNGNQTWIAGARVQGPNTPLNTISRFLLATDTTNATDRSTLSLTRHGIAAAGNSSSGWWMGGRVLSPSSTVYNNVDRTTYATDTTNAADRADQFIGVALGCAFSNGTFGWTAGGRDNGGTRVNTIQRLDFAADTTNMLDRSDLFTGLNFISGVTNTSYGWTGGGESTVLVNNIQRLDFVSDTTNALDRADMLTDVGYNAAISDGNYGWFGGGFTGVGYTNSNAIQRMSFASDTTNAIDRSDMIANFAYHSGSNNSAGAY